MRGPNRSLWLATAAALTFAGLQALPSATASAKPSPAAADHRVVRRSADGHVTFLGSTDARALAPSPRAGGAVAAARAHLEQVGPALGLRSARTDLAGGRKTSLAAGRSVVRFDQQIGGVPVFAGQVVVSLADDGALTSVLADVSSAGDVAGTTVSQARAERTALAATAKAEGVRVGSLSVSLVRRVVFDPAVVGVALPIGAVNAWQLEVTNGTDVRELVIVGGPRGAVLLRFNQVADALNRTVCNNKNVRRSADIACTNPVRSEGQGSVANADVNNAYVFAGRTAAMFAEAGGIDLTEFIGKGSAGHRELRSTVNWCYTADIDADCPMQNAFWNGEQMFYGQGYASADDVVAHELTHGVTQNTANLLYFHQSGAMNESFSDIFGEIVDHRTTNDGEDPAEFLLGEDLVPDGPFRSMSDPTAKGDPDRMTSANYVADNTGADNGGVHTNSGVGNKLFYLIANGEMGFNGYDVTKIDTDPGLPKSARLFYEALVSLVSGSEYADLAAVLPQRCDELAGAGTLGFTTADCDEVDKAILATELDQSPTGDAAQPADAPADCPGGTFKEVLFDGEGQMDQLKPSHAKMWTRVPNYAWGLSPNARSGIGSWFVWNPDPSIGDPADTSLSMTKGVTVPVGQPTYVRFEHWRVFEWNLSSTYYDGGTLDLWKDDGSGTYSPVDNGAYTWDNGPTEAIQAVSLRLGFGGDSHGWVSSRMDLSPMAGEKIKLVWTAHGDADTWFFGWFLDDIEVYTCGATPPTVTNPQQLKAVATGSPSSPGAKVTWKGPAHVGAGLDYFIFTRTGGAARQIVAGDPQPTVRGLTPGKDYTFSVRAVDKEGRVGPLVSTTIKAVKVSFAASRARIHRGDPVKLSGRVTRTANGAGVGGLKVYLLYKRPAGGKWSNAGWIKTNAKGYYGVRIAPAKTYVYRFVVFPSATYFAAESPVRKVTVVR